MKAKKLIPILALTIGLSAFGGCTNVDQKVTFTNYWNENVLDTTAQINETLVYDVAFEANDVSLVDYTMQYTEGTYTANLVSATENGKTVYTYKTELSIKAHYTLNEETATFTDSVTSMVKFLAGSYGFQPISSEKEINASSPTAISAPLEACYPRYHYATKITYNEDGSAGASTVTRYSIDDTTADPSVDENSFEIDQKKFSYLDNEQLLVALRGINTRTTSAKFLVYSPFVEAVQKVSCTFSTEESKEFSFYKNGSADKVTETITCRPVSIVLDEPNPGATQKALIAKPVDTSKNTHRNIILSLETPLAYGLGTMIYTLRSVSYQ